MIDCKRQNKRILIKSFIYHTRIDTNYDFKKYFIYITKDKDINFKIKNVQFYLL